MARVGTVNVNRAVCDTFSQNVYQSRVLSSTDLNIIKKESRHRSSKLPIQLKLNIELLQSVMPVSRPYESKVLKCLPESGHRAQQDACLAEWRRTRRTSMLQAVKPQSSASRRKKVSSIRHSLNAKSVSNIGTRRQSLWRTPGFTAGVAFTESS